MGTRESKLGTEVNPLKVEAVWPDGDVTTAKLADEAVTAAKLDDAAIAILQGAGIDASVTPGPATLTGANVGDVVLGVVNLSTPGVISADFEAVITVADQIQQADGNHDTDVLVVHLLRRGA